jgi:BirA family transcriptional regulator, biotin operon repressor / biotin---[acetyl-CoA-carboxylase] ligase
MIRSLLQIFDSVSSTMDVARENILTGRVHFDSLGQSNYGGVMAQEQTAGRGQRGRIWYAEPGANLNVTYYFRRGPTDPQHAGEIAMLAGVAVVRAMPEPSSSLSLKWPNDVLLHGKKVGGILVEMVKAPDEAWVALIGVGINLSVREFPPEFAERATSLLREGVTPPDAKELGERILVSLHALADIWQNRGFGAILDGWRQYAETVGRKYETEVEGETLSGMADGVDARGALLLRMTDGRVLTVTSATSLREIG